MHPDVIPNSDAPAGGGASAGKAGQRLRGAVVAAVCTGFLVVAWTLSPDSIGYGTHRQMGLPGCSLMVNTGWPCPSCGMTTAVSATVHGNLGAAIKAQPFGIVLALGAAVFAAAGLAEAVSGRAPRGIFRPRWWYLLIALGGMLLGWAVKLAVGVADGTFPMR